MSQETDPTFSGVARLYAPHGASWGAVRYDPDADGIIVVDSAAVADLLSFPLICPEISRPAPEPVPDHVSREQDARHIAEIGERLREQARVEMQGELAAVKAEAHAALAKQASRIAELEDHLHTAQEPAAELEDHLHTAQELAAELEGQLHTAAPTPKPAKATKA